MFKEKNLLTILILAFLVTVAWVGLSVYHNAKTSTINDALNVQIKPIAPNFDTQTINNLSNRQQVQPQYSISQISQPALSPTTPVSQSNELASPAATQTQGGTP